MTELDRAIAELRGVPRMIRCADHGEAYVRVLNIAHNRIEAILAALDAARGEAVLLLGGTGYEPSDVVRIVREWEARKLSVQAPPAALAVPAANVTPMRQPRADLARLVESINAAVYANGDGLSVTEAIGALELAKLELLKEQEQ